MLSTGNVALSLSLFLFSLLQAAAGGRVYLLSPAEGDYLQGVVTVSGGMDVEGFLSYETAFAYENGREPEAWFLINREVNLVQKGTLAVWDTTTITDGDYRLRVTVQLEGGEPVETVVRDLRVRNYSPIPAGAAAPTVPAASGAAAQPPPALAPPMDLPPNPAELTGEGLKAGILSGLAGALILLAGLGVFSGLRRLLKKP